MSIYIGDKEIKDLCIGGSSAKEVYLGDTKVRPSIKNFATQGPCPEWFHVPLDTEWQAVYDIRTALGGGSSDGTNFGIALKLPFAGYRLYSTAALKGQGTYGYYWSSSPVGSVSPFGASNLSMASSFVRANNNSYRAQGSSVRPFYNEGIAPNGGWQVLYQGTGSAGIYWHKDLGLITASSNGTTWVTIADKNLGATTVWNSGNTLSEANCGKYYQRGNNYGFPRTGGVTTSSTQVDANTYGPGNYYNSSTFIKRSSSPYDWSSVQNDNLWGGVDGNVPV